MNGIGKLASWIYRQMAACYPAGFQAEFRDEMEAVFARAMEEAGKLGKRKLWNVVCRELREWPRAILVAHLQTRRYEMERQSGVIQSPAMEAQPGTWGAAILAGLPHFLIGLLMGLGKIVSVEVGAASLFPAVAAASLLAVLIIGLMTYAWRRGWPVWSASWYLYSAWLVLVVLGLGVERLNLDESWRYTNAMFAGWVVLAILGYFSILFKSRLHGLLSVAFLFPFLGLTLLEFVPNPIEGWLAIGLGLVFALGSGAVVRMGEFRPAVVLVLGLNLLSGFMLAYVGEYQMKDLPAGIPAHVPGLSSLMKDFALYGGIAVGVIALPFLLRGLWDFSKRILPGGGSAG